MPSPSYAISRLRLKRDEQGSCSEQPLLDTILLSADLSCRATICRGETLPEAVRTQKPNIVLAAECVYFEPAFPLLMQTLKDLFVLNEDAVVYFCFKKRRRADMQFVKSAKKAFHVEEIFDQDRSVFQRQALFLFSFKSKPRIKQGGCRR